jgi:2-dehydro-3-deoxyphosphogluconate aldolase/(4S)-4-hydroxy-2-oxoglutarate aldolase
VDIGIPITPGVTSPTDIDAAMEFGLDVLKFFPAEASGGLGAIKAMAAPYPMVKFMPTGGINEKNITSYMQFDKILACGGSWMVHPDLIRAGAFDKIQEMTRKALLTMLDFELKHVGINCDNAQEATGVANTFAGIFGLGSKEGSNSAFAGNIVEAMNRPYRGARGHIAMGTTSVLRAVHYLESQGIQVDMETAKYKNDQLMLVYLKEEVGGFALHLLQK